VQERSEILGQRRRQRLRVLPGAVIALAGILSTSISATPNNNPSETVQIPAVLRQWTQDPFPPNGILRAFKQGIDHYNHERYAAALDSFPSSRDSETTAISDYILFYRAKSRLMLKQYKEALDDFRLLEKRFPSTSLIQDALIGQCKALLELKDFQSILTLLNSRNTDGLPLNRRPEILYYQAKSLSGMGEKDRAVALYLQIFSSHPTSEYSPLAERSLLSLSPLALKGARNYGIRLQRAENLLKTNDARGARLLLIALGRVTPPDSKSSQKRDLLRAEAEYRLKKTSIALPYLRKVTASEPLLHARAIYLEGTSYRRLDKEQLFLASRDKALKLYPRSNDTEELCYSAATYYEVNYDSAKAQEAYRVLYRAFPKGQHVESTLWKIALYSYIEKQYEEAALGFWNYLRTYSNPLSAGSALYWMGRCYEKLGDSKKADYLYSHIQTLVNNSYYGQRARETQTSLRKTEKDVSISGLDFRQVVATCDGIQYAPIRLQEPDRIGIQIIERARQLVSAGLPELAITELRWGIRQYSHQDNLFYSILSLIYAKEEKIERSIASLRRIFPDYNGRPLAALPIEIWQKLYPARHWDIVTAQAARTSIEPALIMGLIRQESAFENNAQSRANARGLMQILPSTGKLLARQAKIKRFSAQKLFHAETNIMLGTRFLNSLLQQYGKTEIALAAYNAGESRADRWLMEYGDTDMAEFVERIPFSETRNYVKQVLSNKMHYDLLTATTASTAR
jgi:soluble lytic murein transglycosylase